MEGSKEIFQFSSPHGLDSLIQEVMSQGYTVIGPRLDDGVVGLGIVTRSSDLPQGVTDVQEKGYYRLQSSGAMGHEGFFAFNLGPKSWKAYLFPPERLLWSMPQGGTPTLPPQSAEDGPSYAFFGVRACELAAIRIQDRILYGEGRDPHYTKVRRRLLIIGVHCQKAAATCFCPSMGTGPHFPASGYDLLLTEIGEKYYVQIGSDRGRAVVKKLHLEPAPSVATQVISDQIASTKAQIKRAIPQDHIKEDIYAALKSPHWENVGQRCLACANCTMVCPTCFCTTQIDTADIKEESACRKQAWDSCFHLDFTYMHSGSLRVSHASRYRQWLSHKLGTWIDQFGSSGCVGCGRCITWCPVGIDLTEEMAQLRTTEPSRSERHER